MLANGVTVHGGRLPYGEPMRWPGSAGDPYWANVVALLHLDSDFTDKTGKSWSGVNSPTIGSGTVKFGAGAAVLNGSKYIEGPTSSDWSMGTGDYTVECWAYLTAWPTGAWYCPVGNSGSSTGWEFQVSTSGQFHWAVPTQEANLSSAVGAFTTGTWHFCSFSRVGANRYLGLDGTIVASGSTSINDTNTAAVRIGANRSGTDFWNGFVDEVRITKGVGRYTQSFAAPTQPFYSKSSR